jgi:hypothetical protein
VELARVSLDKETIAEIEGNNMRLWYWHPMRKRIAVGFEGMMNGIHKTMHTWDVVDINDENLSTRIQERKNGLRHTSMHDSNQLGSRR